jgi:hypothetical protein
MSDTLHLSFVNSDSDMRLDFGARQYYDNDNSQRRPGDFGWKLRGARQISRE